MAAPLGDAGSGKRGPVGGGPCCVNTVNSVVPDIFADLLHGQLLLSGDALHADQDIQLDRVGLNLAFTMAVNTECTLVVLIVHTIAPGAPPGGEPAASEAEAGHGEPSSPQAIRRARPWPGALHKKWFLMRFFVQNCSECVSGRKSVPA